MRFLDHRFCKRLSQAETPHSLFVNELGGVRRLRRKALPLPYLGHKRVEHVGGDGLPELEVSVPDGFAGGGPSHHLAQVEGFRGRYLPLAYCEDLLLLDVDEISTLASDHFRDGPG